MKIASKNGTHHFFDSESQRERQLKRIKNKTHNWLDGTIASETQKRLLKEEKHNFIGLSKKRVEDGSHNLVGMVSCYNKQGKCVQIPKEQYHSQTGPKEDWEYVHNTSKEGQRRKHENN